MQMTALKEAISHVRDALLNGAFMNEASVSHGVVLPILHALDWPVFNTRVVAPEYVLEGRRVDYALCDSRLRPMVFVEVKQPGKGEGADRQLFEYAFHAGVPMAVLTDGQEWHFYLPAEQGNYQERRVYKLDLVERDLDECANRLSRYLSYNGVCDGEAFQNARSDYQSVRKQRDVAATMPVAWLQLLQNPDNALIELLAEEVESLCGYKPDPDTVSQFLSDQTGRPRGEPVRPRTRSPEKRTSPEPGTDTRPGTEAAGDAGMPSVGFELAGQFTAARNAIDVLAKVFVALSERDPTFLERFSALPKHGKRRRWTARNREDLYPGRPDLMRDCSREVKPGWWMGTNYGSAEIAKIVDRATALAGLRPGVDLKIQLAKPAG